MLTVINFVSTFTTSLEDVGRWI